jgi:hypothetical protein
MFDRSIAYYKGIFLDLIPTLAKCRVNHQYPLKNLPDGFPKPSALGQRVYLIPLVYLMFPITMEGGQWK